MALAAVERNALLEQVWILLEARNYPGIVKAIGDLPLDEYVNEPELGVTLCYAQHQLGELEGSLLLVQRLKEVCERRGNTLLSRRRTNCEGLLRIARGEYNVAEPLLMRVLSQAEEAEDTRMTAWVYNNLGILHIGRGTWDFALSHFRRSVAAGHRIGDMRHISLCKLNMAIAYLRMGSLKEAREHVEFATELSREAGSASELAHIEYASACIFEAEGDLSMAWATASVAQKRFADLPNPKGLSGVQHLYGRLSTKEGRIIDARRYLEGALTAARETIHKEEEAFIMESMANLALAEGDRLAWVKYLRAAISLFSTTGSTFQVARLQSRLSDATT